MIQRYFQAVWNSSCAAWPGTRLVICRTGPNCQLYNRDLAFELSGILFILGRAWAYSEALLVGLSLGLGFPHLLSGLSKWAWPCHLPPIFLSPKELKNSIGLPIARVTLLVTRGLQKPLRRVMVWAVTASQGGFFPSPRLAPSSVFPPSNVGNSRKIRASLRVQPHHVSFLYLMAFFGFHFRISLLPECSLICRSLEYFLLLVFPFNGFF